MTKTTLESVIGYLKELDHIPYDEIENEIIIAFGDYEFEGKTDVIISNEEYNQYQAYINHTDAPILVIDVEYCEDSPELIDQYTVTKVRIA